MRLAPCSVTRIGASIAILGAVALGCASESTTGLAVPDAMYAKGGGSGPTIKSTNPSRGEPGTTLDVRIFGSGFEAGSQASFALDGVVGGNIVTNSTTVISSGELAANISISSGAELTTYDVIVVTPGGKKGIGTEMFLVTYEAVDLGGHPELGMTEAEDVNASGTIVGNAGHPSNPNPFHAVRWVRTGEAAFTLEDLSPLLDAFRSRAFAINDGGAIVGWRQVTENTSSTRPFLLSPEGVLTELGTDCGPGETSSLGYAVDISDRGDVVGARTVPGPSDALYWAPGATCAEILPDLGGNAEASAVSADGNTIVGIAEDAARTTSRAVRWTRAGDGSPWTLEILDNTGPASPVALDTDGSVIGYRQISTAVRKRGSTYTDFTSDAYRWASWGRMTLQSLGGDQEYALGAGGGLTVGMANDRIDYPSRAVLWQPDGSVADLGAMVVGGYSRANAIAGGLIVGSGNVSVPGRGDETHALVWIMR